MKFEYVTQKEVAQARKEIEPVILKVQDFLRRKGILTFQYCLVGSAGKRHLVTRVIGGNKGFDLDYNLALQQISEEYRKDAKKIKLLFIDLFNKFKPKHFECCENSTSVFTIKRLDSKTGNILYSFDFAIVHYYIEEVSNPEFDEEYDNPEDEYYNEERQEYIKYNKADGSYQWELRPIAKNHVYIEAEIRWNNLWNDLKQLYLEKKNRNQDPNKKSRVIYYETLNEMWQKYFD